MPPILVLFALILGGIGVYLAMPGGRLHFGKAALIVLLAAGGALFGGIGNLTAGGAEAFWFCVLSAIGLWGAIRVVTHRRPVYSALYFILVVVAIAGLLVLMQAEFLAMGLLTIYAGAILVTYVFVIMLAQQTGTAPYDSQAREPMIGCIAGFLLLSIIAGGVTRGALTPAIAAEIDSGAGVGSTLNIGVQLLTNYVVAIQLAGVLLLAAMVGAIAIARRRAVADIPGGDFD